MCIFTDGARSREIPLRGASAIVVATTNPMADGVVWDSPDREQTPMKSDPEESAGKDRLGRMVVGEIKRAVTLVMV